MSYQVRGMMTHVRGLKTQARLWRSQVTWREVLAQVFRRVIMLKIFEPNDHKLRPGVFFLKQWLEKPSSSPKLN